MLKDAALEQQEIVLFVLLHILETFSLLHELDLGLAHLDMLMLQKHFHAVVVLKLFVQINKVTVICPFKPSFPLLVLLYD